MLQALFQLVAVLTEAQNLMLYLPGVALDQNVDLVTQCHSCCRCVRTLLP